MTSELPPSVTPSGKPKLLDQVRQEIRVRHMALSTERLYVNWIRRFIFFHHVRHPAEMGKAEVSAFLTHLAVDGQVSSSTQNQALSALLFLTNGAGNTCSRRHSRRWIPAAVCDAGITSIRRASVAR